MAHIMEVKKIVLYLFLLLFIINCGNPLLPDTSNVDNDFINNSIDDDPDPDDPDPQIFKYYIRYIYVTSLDPSDWDPGLFATPGDPYFKIYINNSLVATTSYIQDATKNDFPHKFLVNKQISIGSTMKVKLFDKDVVVDDEMGTWESKINTAGDFRLSSSSLGLSGYVSIERTISY